MPAPSKSHKPIALPNKPDKMVTLKCAKCSMALYMSEKTLHMPTWKCPSCGAITRTSG